MIKKISKKQLRDFGYLIGFGLPFLIGWLIPLINGHPFRYWTLWISFPSLLIGIIRPELLKMPFKAWMKFGHLLGWINSRIILGLVFIVILLPISLVMKFFGYDPLRLKKSNLISYRENKKDSRVDLKRIF